MKKKAVVIIAVIATLTGFGVSALDNPKPAKATDSPLIQEVQHQGEVLDNHEGRITNTEKDVTDIQNKTATSPASERVTVRNVTTPSTDPRTDPVFTAPSPAPPPTPPAPVTITGATQLPIDGTENIDCKLSYSDGTSYRWDWLRFWYLEDGSKAGRKSNYINCDNSLIGQVREPGKVN